ncbi:MAG: FeoB-associated Cys-rich membrane protein [Ruminococcus sp.]|nr:FeoB-associated Cys-rich membrane protein [uncultured Ruminococcus sp.]
MDLILSNLGTIIVALIVAAVLGLIIVNIIRKRKQGKTSCGCGCQDCPMKGKCH